MLGLNNLSVQEIVPVLSTQVAVNIPLVIHYVLPLIAGYLTMAMLAVTPRTQILRIALWPVIAFLALYAVRSVDLSAEEPTRRNVNMLFTFSMISIATRTFDWMLPNKPLVRYQPPMKGPRSTIMEALDLASTLRGYGWEWARRVHFPRETRPTDRLGFVAHTMLSAVVHALFFGIIHIGIRSFSLAGHRTIPGGTIFDDTLPFQTRYVRACVISACAWCEMYTYIQMCYDACTLIAVVFLGQDPTQWPPAFDAPWRATSLASFWRQRWHQFFRRTFLVQGGFPLASLFGRTGLVIGAFLSSGILHHIAMLSFNDQLEPWRIISGFGMMGPGILAEEAYEKWMGQEVGGVLGWVWTMTWFFLWGNLSIDGFARAGYFGVYGWMESVIPHVGRRWIEQLVSDFEDWLHSTLQ